MTTEEEAIEYFEDFWTTYPRKVGKAMARKWFIKNRPTYEQMGEILNGLLEHIKVWKGTEMKFIPHATTWLNQERWEDDISGEFETVVVPKYVDSSNYLPPEDDDYLRQAAAQLKRLEASQ